MYKIFLFSFGDWSLFGMYPDINPFVIEKLGTDNMKYRVLAVFEKEGYEILPSNGETLHLNLCELHGPTGKHNYMY